MGIFSVFDLEALLFCFIGLVFALGCYAGRAAAWREVAIALNGGEHSAAEQQPQGEVILINPPQSVKPLRTSVEAEILHNAAGAEIKVNRRPQILNNNGKPTKKV